MKIAYCKTCSPKKAIEVGPTAEVERHKEGAAEHTDMGVITVADDPQGAAETTAAYLTRIDGIHVGSYT